MPEIKILHKFLAVTLNPVSIFLVTDDRDANGDPVVKCLAARSLSAISKGFVMHGGELVAVTKRGLILYHDPFCYPKELGPQRPTPIDKVEEKHWGQRTGEVACLLLEDETRLANLCFHVRGLRCLDDRLQAHTKRVLELISDFHPTFVISKSPDYAVDYGE